MSDTKLAQNIYGIIDNELSRMHEILKIELQMHRDSNFQRFSSSPTNAQSIYKRIQEFQNILLEAVRKHDELVQEKVAELALMGTKE